MPRNKDKSTKVTIIIDDKQGASICKSFRLKEGVNVEKSVVKFLKDNNII